MVTLMPLHNHFTAVRRGHPTPTPRIKDMAKKGMHSLGSNLRQFYREEDGFIDLCIILSGLALGIGFAFAVGRWGSTNSSAGEGRKLDKASPTTRPSSPPVTKIDEVGRIAASLAEIGQMPRNEEGIAAALRDAPGEPMHRAADLHADAETLYRLIADIMSYASPDTNVCLRAMDTLVRKDIPLKDVFNRVFVLVRWGSPWSRALLKTDLIDEGSVATAKAEATSVSIRKATHLFIDKREAAQFEYLKRAITTNEQAKMVLDILFKDRWYWYDANPGTMNQTIQCVADLISFIASFVDGSIAYKYLDLKIEFRRGYDRYYYNIDGQERSSEHTQIESPDFSAVILKGLVKRMGAAAVVEGLRQSGRNDKQIVEITKKSGVDPLLQQLAQTSDNPALLMQLARLSSVSPTVTKLARQRYNEITGLNVA